MASRVGTYWARGRKGPGSGRGQGSPREQGYKPDPAHWLAPCPSGCPSCPQPPPQAEHCPRLPRWPSALHTHPTPSMGPEGRQKHLGQLRPLTGGCVAAARSGGRGRQDQRLSGWRPPSARLLIQPPVLMELGLHARHAVHAGAVPSWGLGCTGGGDAENRGSHRRGWAGCEDNSRRRPDGDTSTEMFRGPCRMD